MSEKYTLEQAEKVIKTGLKTCEDCPEFDGVKDCSLDCWEDVAWPCAKIVIANREIIISSLQHKDDTMECCGNCAGNHTTIPHDTCKESFSEKYGDVTQSDGWCECWQPRGNDEGGEL